MGRSVRRVPATWQHPRWPDDHYEPRRRGRYIPLHAAGFPEADAEWDEGYAKWQEGYVTSYGEGGPWRARMPDDGPRFSEWHGQRPSPDDYMPDWPAAERTHLMMYEDTSEGTPISPAFASPEDLARWLADSGASAFGEDTATYDQWLAMIGQGWAPSAVVMGGQMMSGVAASTTSLAAEGSDGEGEQSEATELNNPTHPEGGET